MQKEKRIFTLIELLVIDSHLYCHGGESTSAASKLP